MVISIFLIESTPGLHWFFLPMFYDQCRKLTQIKKKKKRQILNQSWYGRQSSFQLIVESSLDLHWFLLLRSLIGSENTRRPFDQSDEKLTSSVIVTYMFTRDFPRLKQFACFEFPLVPSDIYLCSDWALW